MRRGRPGLDVFLFPAPVGGGAGDVEEVLTVGRRLACDGIRVWLYRLPGRPWPVALGGRFDLTGLRRCRRLPVHRTRAMTVSSQFGVTAAEGRPGRYGGAGPWAAERADIERAYGLDQVVHVSLEEFARNLPLDALAMERYREGGWGAPACAERRRSRSWRAERERFGRLYRRFRAFDDPRVLHLYPTFTPSSGFRREFPEAVEVGPVWPDRPPRRRRPPGHRTLLRTLWYASPSTAPRILPGLSEGHRRSGRRALLLLRARQRFPIPPAPRLAARWLRPQPPAAWRRLWSSSDLVIATGSRSLLEAIEWGGPFLYFNGLLGTGRRARRHRPEKLRSLLARVRSLGGSGPWRRDLDRFSRGRDLAGTVARALSGSVRPPRRLGRHLATALPPPVSEGGEFVRSVAHRWAGSSLPAAAIVAEARRAGRRDARPRALSKV